MRFTTKTLLAIATVWPMLYQVWLYLFTNYGNHVDPPSVSAAIEATGCTLILVVYYNLPHRKLDEDADRLHNSDV